METSLVRPAFTEQNAKNIFNGITGLKLKVVHVHQGNTSIIGPKKKRKYGTYAWIEDQNRNILAEGGSACSRRDVPSRKIGRAIAIGRCLKEYWKGSNGMPHVDNN